MCHTGHVPFYIMFVLVVSGFESRWPSCVCVCMCTEDCKSDMNEMIHYVSSAGLWPAPVCEGLGLKEPKEPCRHFKHLQCISVSD